MSETYTIGVIVTMLLSALGAFMSNKIMLVSNHEKQLEKEQERTAEEKQRADRLMEIVMRAVGASEALIAVASSRDVRDEARDARDMRERSNR